MLLCFCKDEYFEKYLPDYKNLDELKEHYRRGGLGDVKIKKFLFNVLEETLNPIRERRAVLQADIAAVMKVLEDGCVKANEKANATLKRAKDAMKINYFDDKDNIIEWYFDISRSLGIEDGVPYQDDLYLDVVVVPDGRIHILDEDELEEAYNKREISKDEYDMAFSVANMIINGLESREDIERLIKFSENYLTILKNS